MYPLIIYPLTPSDTLFSPRLLRLKISLAILTGYLKRTYLVSTDVKVKGSYLPTSLRTTSSMTLVVLEE